MKIFDLTNDSIELHARPPEALRKTFKDDDHRLEGIPEGYVEATACVGGEMLVLWFPPEAAHKLGIGFSEKAQQCRERVYDPR